MPIQEETVYAALKQVRDPELMVNVVDLGLIYGVAVEDAGEKTNLGVMMTMTTPACPYGPQLVADVRDALKALDGAGEVKVEVTLSSALVARDDDRGRAGRVGDVLRTWKPSYRGSTPSCRSCSASRSARSRPVGTRRARRVNPAKPGRVQVFEPSLPNAQPQADVGKPDRLVQFVKAARVKSVAAEHFRAQHLFRVVDHVIENAKSGVRRPVCANPRRPRGWKRLRSPRPAACRIPKPNTNDLL